MSEYSYDVVARHIRKKHPGCPDFAVEFFAREVACRSWKKASIGKAVGITMQNYLRHRMTDYDTLLLSGLDRKEALRQVQPRINAMLTIWQKSSESISYPDRR